MQSLPEKWEKTKKIAMTKKQEVGPLQAEEVTKIRKSVSQFDKEQQALIKQWRAVDAFKYTAQQPYQDIDDVSPHDFLFLIRFLSAKLINLLINFLIRFFSIRMYFFFKNN